MTNYRAGAGLDEASPRGDAIFEVAVAKKFAGDRKFPE
jgi:hypothetical protein